MGRKVAYDGQCKGRYEDHNKAAERTFILKKEMLILKHILTYKFPQTWKLERDC